MCQLLQTHLDCNLTDVRVCANYYNFFSNTSIGHGVFQKAENDTCIDIRC